MLFNEKERLLISSADTVDDPTVRAFHSIKSIVYVADGSFVRTTRLTAILANRINALSRLSATLSLSEREGGNY